MQEAFGLDHFNPRVVWVRIIHEPYLPCFFNAQDPFGRKVRRYNAGYARLRMKLFCVVGEAQSAHDFNWLKSRSVQYHKLRRPVTADYGVLVFETFELAHIDRSRIKGASDLCYGIRFFHPEVYHSRLAVPAYGIHVSS